MNVTIYPSRFILDKNFLGSKDLTQRYLIASWLSNEPIILDNIADNEDVESTLNFFKALKKEVIYTSKHSLYIKPSNKREILPEITINVNKSKTTLFYLLPVALNCARKVTFIGDIEILKDALLSYGRFKDDCNLSIQIKNDVLVCSGSINLDYYECNNYESSKLITGLIINSLFLKKAITIHLNENNINNHYLQMTIQVFKDFGFDITLDNNNLYIHNQFLANWDYRYIESDYGVCANFFALASLNGSLSAYYFHKDSLQYESIIIDLLKSMGGYIKHYEEANGEKIYVCNNSLLEKGQRKQLKAINYDLLSCFNLSFILMVCASYAISTSKFYNLDKLNMHEKRRIMNICEILKQLNVNIIINENEVLIKGKNTYNNNVSIDCKNDHRITMAICIFALLNNGCIKIDNVDCVYKSDYNFFDTLIQGCKSDAIIIKK
ncbi:MAG: hypothetical protein MR270_06105 [Erysipelotrichaceae bacterium]|nr:hypothetical protein [Erysipelotrichaceae bacterium]